MSAKRLAVFRDGAAFLSLAAGSFIAVAAGDTAHLLHTETAAPSMPMQVRPATGDFPDVIVDPLRALPGRVDEAPALPGDASALDCTAQPGLQSQTLGLSDVVDLTLCHNPQVQASWAAIKLQAALLGQSKAAWLPTANATISDLRSRTTYPATPALDSSSDGHTAYVGLTWRIFDFGARAADQASATRLLDAALANQDAALQKALGAAIQAYFDAISSRASMRSRGDATRYAQETLEATGRREANGVAAAGDTLQAKAALAKAHLTEQRAIGDYQKAISVLLYACGLRPESNVALVEEADTVPASAVAELADWLSVTMARHPAILAARAQVDAAEAKVHSVRTQGLPSVDFTGNYYKNGYPNQGLQPTRSATTTVGITLNIPLFEGFARTYQVRAAQAQVDQSRAQLVDTQLQLASTVVKDHADAVAALNNLESSAQWLGASKLAVESARRRYDKGAADILDLTSAESSLADAKQERIRCLAEWRSARLRLFADSGNLGRSEIANEAHAPR